MNNRKGKIKISSAILEECMAEKPIILKELFGNFYPCHIEANPFDGMLSYWGFSNYFEEIAEGAPVPEYDAVVSEKDGEVSVTFKKL